MLRRFLFDASPMRYLSTKRIDDAAPTRVLVCDASKSDGFAAGDDYYAARHDYRLMMSTHAMRKRKKTESKSRRRTFHARDTIWASLTTTTRRRRR